ncbi:ABC transporter permease subunit [Derxia lacustris]|uniref:ABC transporter permease subunit n=1 Tax=Derxia lacustris TaxID=764842 RepID=UPI000A17687F|nr:ABC transporter permease subunit [Derxia lacustris]
MSALPNSSPAPGRVARIAAALGSRTVIGIPFAWLIAFFAVPFLIVLKISVSDSDGINFMPLFGYEDGVAQLRIKLSNYLFIGTDELYFAAYLSSIKYAAITTVICLFIGYPFSYFMARSPASRRPALLMLVMLPFWTSFLLRIYAWKGLLDDNGVFNNILTGLGMIHEPIHMMHTPFSLVVGMVYAYVPFMILPLYANLSKMDLRLLEAAADLGTTPFRAFWLITVPLSRAGIIAGAMLVFIPCIGEFVIPELLGGPETLMIGRVLWDEFFSNNDWAMASAVAVLMILLIIVPIAVFNHYQAQAEGAGK